MFKNVPNTNGASSSDSLPLLNNTSDKSKGNNVNRRKVSYIFEIKTVT